MQQSTNKEACRDLTGRRIRHVNNEKKLKEFVEQQNELAKEKEEKKREKLEKRKKKREDLEHSHHLFVDPQYDKAKEKIANDLNEAIGKAISEKKKSEEKPRKEEAKSSNASSDNEESLKVADKIEPAQKGPSPKDINKKANTVPSGSKSIYSDWMGCDDLDVSSSDEDSEEEAPKKS